MSKGPVARVGTVMLDCTNPDVLVAFWGKVLDIEEKARYPDFVWMSRISDGGPALAFQVVPENKTAKNRMHFDLTVENREGFVEYVESLGGKKVADHEIEGFHWTVMVDPEGNEFCVTLH
jgi:predicted enzyme related to lactoylglutathione lyase